MIIKEIPKEERPRERLLKYGVESLSSEELLAILLRNGSKNKSARELSLEVLKMCGDVTALRDVTLGKLLTLKGIGKVKAMELISCVELGRRICYQDATTKNLKVVNSKNVYDIVKNWFVGKKQECFYCLYFNNKQELIERKLLFMGTVNKSVVHPREVFKHAYLSSASSIICVHNHPSGDVTPSKEDIALTKALVEIGRIQSIPVLDHVIIGCDKYYSFSDSEGIERW